MFYIPNDPITKLRYSLVEFYRFHDFHAGKSPIPPQPSKNNKGDIINNLISVVDDCLLKRDEFSEEIRTWPLKKDVDDLLVVISYVIDSEENWNEVFKDHYLFERLEELKTIIENSK